MRGWGAEAVTSLVRAALAFNYEPPLHENLKLQCSVLAPLSQLSGIPQGDVRQKQLECVLHVLQNTGDRLQHGWPQVLTVMGAVDNDQGEKLIQTAFQCLQLVVTDFLPVIPSPYLQVCVEVAAKFGLQNRELNVSLTAIGLLWNVSDFFYQNRQRIQVDLTRDAADQQQAVADRDGKQQPMAPFDALWMCLFSKLGDLCVDLRPAVRKSAGQTLFSTVSAHGALLQQDTWKKVLWQVLFPLLDRVQQFSSSASTTRDAHSTGNILIHHSRDTAEKQWAETRVLTLAGVARTFNAKRKILQQLGDFPRAWSLLLEHIESSALCRNAEVALAALKSFQEILHISRGEVAAPGEEVISRSGDSSSTSSKGAAEARTSIPKPAESDMDIALWSNAWKVWLNIGTLATRPPEAGEKGQKVYVPAQNFLTALLQTFPPLLEHIKTRFVSADLSKLSTVLRSALAVPVHGEASPFVIPSFPDVVITPLQEAALQAMDVLVKAIKGGTDSMQTMYPDIFDQLLTFVEYGVRAPKYGQLETKAFGTVKGPQVDWVTMNFVPFSEKAVEMVVELYSATARHPSVVNAGVLQNIIKTFRLPLGLKYSCPSPTTWPLVINSLFAVLQVGLPVARKSDAAFHQMWNELALAFEDFLFSKYPAPATMSVEDCQRDEAVDCKVIQVIRDDILPYARNTPRDFTTKIMDVLNRGSIHSANSDAFVDTESTRKLREDFAKLCFETLLQFSFTSTGQGSGAQGQEEEEEEGGAVTRLAVVALLQRCQEVVRKYVEDERLSGKCPLPRPRLAEMSSVLKAVSTLLQSLKRAPPSNVEASVWGHVVQLYPHLVECCTSPSPQVCKALKEALLEYRDLLAAPRLSAPSQNGS